MMGGLRWAYRAINPYFSPKMLGSPSGPATSPRIKLRDGRHLAYIETGVPKEKAKYKIVFVHGYGSSKEFKITASQELVEELGIYFLQFDRAGYGESDPNPKRSPKSDAFDIQDLADQLQIGSKFYVLGISMGGATVWGCLKYIPQRLAGATLVAPVINYFWPSFPATLFRHVYGRLHIHDRWRLRIAHYAPFLFKLWMNSKLYLPLIYFAGSPENFCPQDVEIMRMVFANRINQGDKAVQQGPSESSYRDILMAYGTWDFDPTEISNPFPKNEGSVHVWQGPDDRLIPVEMQRYLSSKLAWIKYYEIPNEGHLFMLVDGWCDTILRALLLGEEPSIISS